MVNVFYTDIETMISDVINDIDRGLDVTICCANSSVSDVLKSITVMGDYRFALVDIDFEYDGEYYIDIIDNEVYCSPVICDDNITYNDISDIVYFESKCNSDILRYVNDTIVGFDFDINDCNVCDCCNYHG